MDSYRAYYKKLHKPKWAPPAKVFAPVWIFLYVIIIITFCYIFYLYINNLATGDLLLPLVLNLLFNLLFTTIQFRLEDNLLASIDIVLILATIVWFMYVVFMYSTASGHINPDIRFLIYMNMPYLLWVTYATVLQITITRLNEE